jgi:hypothetical protein
MSKSYIPLLLIYLLRKVNSSWFAISQVTKVSHGNPGFSLQLGYLNQILSKSDVKQMRDVVKII